MKQMRQSKRITSTKKSSKGKQKKKTQKPRNILLIEPRYKNKYPPIGLMKIATYHKLLGDNVVFYKGKVKEFVLDRVVGECIEKLYTFEPNIDWKFKKDIIRKYIGRRTTPGNKYLGDVLKDVPTIFEDANSQRALLEIWLKDFWSYFNNEKYSKEPKWDRVYVTTLFTFYWKITIKAIEDAKLLVKDIKELKVGGVMASLIPKEIEDETGIKPIEGLLDKPGMLDDNKYIIDDLPLDYSILDEIDYEYPTGSAYFTFMTKGCTRTCSFCAVPKIEPTYKEKIPTIDKFNTIKELYGEQRNLLLMDNNVLASPKFPEIIQEIKDMGFYKGATFIPPNEYEIVIRNLKNNVNDKAYIRKGFKILKEFGTRRVRRKNKVNFNNLLEKYGLDKLETTTKENLLASYEELKTTIDKLWDVLPRQRYVDFNQGTDARYVTDELMKLMSEIPINPLRIAFDYWGMKKQYVNAVRLAAKYGINRLSNYLLYNFKDRPEDLYKRMQLNIDLSEELGVQIYSFPMKYIPLFGEESKHRRFIGKFWNKKYIRTIQAIVNATKGIVPDGREFFEKAFGKNLEEFNELLYMPTAYIIFRKVFEEDLGLTKEWRDAFYGLNEQELEEAKAIIEVYDFTDLHSKTSNKKILEVLVHYTVKQHKLTKNDENYKRIKKQFDDLIKSDQFIDLTLTYDFE